MTSRIISAWTQIHANRVLMGMRKDGLISFSNNHVHILNHDRLTTLARSPG